MTTSQDEFLKLFSLDAYDRNFVRSERFMAWLCFTVDARYLEQGFVFFPTFRDPKSVSGLVLTLKSKEAELAIIHEKMYNQLVDTKHFEWVTNNKWQYAWLVNELISCIGVESLNSRYRLSEPHLFHPEFFVFPTPRDLVIFLFDICAPPQFSSKLDFVISTQRKWKIANSDAKRLYRWFEPKIKNEANSRCRYFSEWLKNSQYSLLPYQPFEDQEDILIFFVQLERKQTRKVTEPEITLLIEKVKSRWSQKKYRAKLNGKKQYNFVLSDKVIHHLDLMADQHDLSRAEVLEILVKMEAEGGGYLKEFNSRIHARKLLLEEVVVEPKR